MLFANFIFFSKFSWMLLADIGFIIWWYVFFRSFKFQFDLMYEPHVSSFGLILASDVLIPSTY